MSAPLRDRIARFVAKGEGDFAALALELHAWQREHNPDLAALVAGTPPPTRWEEIPAVPVALFRDLALTSFDPSRAPVVFRTSGTTSDRRGTVRLRDTQLYDLGARIHAERIVGPIPTHGLFLHPDREDSSLAHMCRQFVRDATWLASDAGFDRSAAVAALHSLQVATFVAGTALAIHDLLALDAGPFVLPHGSLVMVTGGYKGQVRGVPEGELVPAARNAFPGARVVAEYGMTELSSQLWATPIGARFRAPPWLGVRAVDPWTGESAAEGILRFYDLANVDTVLAIETADLGRVLASAEVVSAEVRAPRAPSRCRAARLLAHVRGAEPAMMGAVLRAIATVRSFDAVPLSQGLSDENATRSLHEACDLVTAGLEAAIRNWRQPPRSVGIVAAHGVFTSPLEWMALYAARGVAVHVKASARDPAFVSETARAFRAEGLEVTASTDRHLPPVETVLAFGADETIAELRDSVPLDRFRGYGHRFSVAVVHDERAAEALADDHARYDTRGCFAPAAVFTLGDPERLARALAAAMAEAERRWPRGTVDPALGPEWRRRVGLARVRGTATLGEAWAVLTMPEEHFTPVALPRMAVVHGVRDLAALDPYRRWLSSCATDDPALPEGFLRVCAPGELQLPAFPRLHDGLPMTTET